MTQYPSVQLGLLKEACLANPATYQDGGYEFVTAMIAEWDAVLLTPHRKRDILTAALNLFERDDRAYADFVSKIAKTKEAKNLASTQGLRLLQTVICSLIDDHDYDLLPGQPQQLACDDQTETFLPLTNLDAVVSAMNSLGLGPRGRPARAAVER